MQNCKILPMNKMSSQVKISSGDSTYSEPTEAN